MKRVLVVVGLVVAGAAVWGVVRYGWYLARYPRLRWNAIAASRREPAAVEAWQKEFGDPTATPRVPDDNATAVRLAELAPGAGVTFKNTDYPPSQHELDNYLDAAMKTDGPVSPPPEAVRSYLDAHKSGLDAVVDLLTHAEPLMWKTEEWQDVSTATPIFGLKQLSCVLVARALADSSAGHAADADRALSAAWQLSVSLRARPLLIEALIAMSMTSAPANLARRLPVDAASWRVRLGDYDARAGVMHALAAEVGRKWSTDDPRAKSQMALAARADYLDLMRVYLTRLRDRPVTVESAGWYREAEAARQGWSTGTMVAGIAQPGFDRAWLGADELALQLELTDRVLQARELKAKLGNWPSGIPDVETSRIPGAHWVYHVDQNGHMSIALNETLKDVRPLLRFESNDPLHK